MLVTIVLLSIGFALASVRVIPLLKMMENWATDFRISALSPPEPQHPDIIIVSITEDTLQRFSYRSPVDRVFLANLLQSLESKGVRAVLLDILLDQSTEPEKDAALKKQLLAMHIPIVVSYGFDQSKRMLTTEQMEYLDNFLPVPLRGMANLVKDTLDDTVRWIYPGSILPDGPYLRGVAGELASKLGVNISSESVPIAWRGAPDSNNSAFRTYPAHLVGMLPDVWFSHKIVLIGADQTLTDRHRTPLSLYFSEQSDKKVNGTPGIVIHAHALAQLLDGRSFPDLSQKAQVALLLVAVLFGLILAWFEINLYLSMVIEFLAILAYWLGAMMVFRHYGVLVPLIAPSLGASFGFWLTLIHVGTETRKQKRLAQNEAKIKAELLANMSHEIRTPINAIIGMTDLVLEEESNAGKRKYLSTVLSSAKSLLRLINDILDYSKMESGKMVMEQIVFDLRQTLEEILETLMVSAKSKGLTLTLEVADPLPNCFIGDPTRLRQVVVNLVGNSIKFTEKGGVTLIVTAEPETEHMLRFAVVDTGIGIPADRLNAIFESYTQAEGATARKHGGTGLGTTISKQIVERMAGRIWVESEEGKGSTFFFVVQIPAALGVSDCRAEYTMPDKTAADSSRSLRILLVDDIEANRNLATIRLEQRHHRVTTAVDGLEAVALEKKEDFDLILMDLNMPRLNGFDAAKAIRAKEAKAASGRRVTIIALTAGDAGEDKERCLAVGMDAWSMKPIDFNKLFILIDRTVPADVGIAIEPVVLATTENDQATLPADLPAAFVGLAGIDVVLGLMTWGDAKLFQQSLVGFGRQHVNDGANIRAALDKGDIQAAKSIAHTLKGAAGNLAATDLAKAASELDSALCVRAGETMSLLELNTILRQRNIELGDLVWAVDQAIQVLAASCQSLEPQTADQVLSATFVSQPLKPEHIALMRQLAEGLERGNADLAETCFEKLKACSVINPESLESIARQMDDLELDTARKTLGEIACFLEIDLGSG